jgi:hypothetical protein
MTVGRRAGIFVGLQIGSLAGREQFSTRGGVN